MTLEFNYIIINKKIEAACLKTKRDPKSVHLLAVSKNQPVHAIQTLYDLGQRDFGENYLSELIEKQSLLKHTCPQIRWHFIGTLQSKQIKHLNNTYFIHSVSRQKEANLINQYSKQKQAILIQVNLDQEPQKGGVLEKDLPDLIKYIKNMPNLDLKGLMLLPEAQKDPEPAFLKLAALKDGFGFSELSMGMSEDFEKAIVCGATWVRVGSALFEER